MIPHNKPLPIYVLSILLRESASYTRWCEFFTYKLTSFINSWNFFNTGCLITSNSTLKFHPNSNDVTLPNILQHINQQTSKKLYKHLTCWWGSVLGLFFFQSIDLYFIPKFTPAEALVVTENCLLEPWRNKQPNFFGSYKAS